MPFIVYETTNLINGKKYRGVHFQDGDECDGYLGSGTIVVRAIEKHGPANFSRTTMFVFEDKASAYAREAVVVDEAWCIRDDTYNVKPGGFGGFPWHDPQYRAAQSARMKATCAVPEFRAAQSARTKAAYADPQHRAAQSARMKATCADPEYRAAHSANVKASWARRRVTKANKMLFIID